jgi:hypothetical protein
MLLRQTRYWFGAICNWGFGFAVVVLLATTSGCFFFNEKNIIINNWSLHKTKRGRRKQNYKTKAPYINGTPMKKTKTVTT